MNNIDPNLVESLHADDQKYIASLTYFIGEILNDDALADYVKKKQEEEELGDFKSIILKEDLSPFLIFLQRKSNDWIRREAFALLSSYENQTNNN